MLPYMAAPWILWVCVFPKKSQTKHHPPVKVFDILPIYGKLEPGETQVATFTCADMGVMVGDSCGKPFGKANVINHPGPWPCFIACRFGWKNIDVNIDFYKHIPHVVCLWAYHIIYRICISNLKWGSKHTRLDLERWKRSSKSGVDGEYVQLDGDSSLILAVDISPFERDPCLIHLPETMNDDWTSSHTLIRLNIEHFSTLIFKNLRVNGLV